MPELSEAEIGQLAQVGLDAYYDYYGENASLARHTENGALTHERERLHRAIIEEAFENTSDADVPEVLFVAGGPGSGKSTLLGTGLVSIPPGAVEVNPDTIREQLPEYRELQRLGNRLAAHLTHGEASMIARRITKAAIETDTSLVIDGVGGGEPGKFAEKVHALMAVGYRIRVVYVDAPLEDAQERAAQRDRPIDPHLVAQLHREMSARFPEIVQMDGISSIEVWSTVSEPPELIAKRDSDPGMGNLEVQDEGAFQRFLAKGGEDGND